MLLVPTLTPFTCHWYVGDGPGLSEVAVKVTFVPVHMLPEGTAVMLISRTTDVLTDIVNVLEIAGLPVAHVSEDVMIQSITSPFDNAEVETVELLGPTLAPFNCH